MILNAIKFIRKTDGIDKMVILEKILQDEKAYEMIRSLLPQDPPRQKAA